MLSINEGEDTRSFKRNTKSGAERLREYITHTINVALTGDVISILKCCVFLFILRYLYIKVRDFLVEAWRRKFKTSDLSKSPSRSKLMNHGYSSTVGNNPPPSRVKK